MIRRRRLAIAWLIGAHALTVGAVSYCWVADSANLWTFGILIALFVAQASILAIWVVMAMGRFVPRLLTALGLMSIATLLIAGPHGMTWQDAIFFAIFFGVIGVPVAIALVPARIRGVHIRRVNAAELANQTDVLRFGLMRLFAWMTVLAGAMFVVSLARSIDMYNDDADPFDFLDFRTSWVVLVFGITGVSFGMAASITLWAALTLGSPWKRLGFVLPVAACTAAVPAYAFEAELLSQYAGFAGIGTVAALIVWATLMVMRACGYRLIRRGSNDVAGPSPETIETISERAGTSI